jgi:hypothetical protein
VLSSGSLFVVMRKEPPPAHIPKVARANNQETYQRRNLHGTPPDGKLADSVLGTGCICEGAEASIAITLVPGFRTAKDLKSISHRQLIDNKMASSGIAEAKRALIRHSR